MTNNHIIYKVFLSSPSDLSKERQELKKKIEEIRFHNISFECVMWEKDLPSMRTDDVQREIDERLLRSADIVVGIFRDKFGCTTSRYPSGTVGEIEDAIAENKPVIMYFLNSSYTCNVGEASEDILRNLLQIREFKREYQLRGIYHDCKDISEAISRLESDLSENIKKVNQHPYSQLINILFNNLKKINSNITKYHAVLLTIPDSQFIWNDEYNDITKHFLDEKKNDIEQSQADILDVIISNNVDHFAKRAYASLIEPYTYRYFNYFFKMFKKIINNTNNYDVYNKMLSLLDLLCNDPVIINIIDVHEIKSFLNKVLRNSLNEKRFEYISICFNKLVSAIIYINIKGEIPGTFILRPLIYDMDNKFIQEYAALKTMIGEEENPNNKIECYKKLYNLLQEQQKEIIDYVASELSFDFFAFVNNKEIQDSLIYNSNMSYDKIIKLYNIFYENIKYRLYRNYSKINEYKGLIRYDLIDRYIALQYVDKMNYDNLTEYKFEHIKHDRSIGDFVIRQANINDLDSIKQLNNPTPPYRRAIYVKSDDHEIETAINNKEVWIIEECITNVILKRETRSIACVAIILDSYNKHDDFNTDSLTKKFAQKYRNRVNRNFRYLDFDSVLTNDGRSNIGNYSYRGCGFQRLMLIFAEILACKLKCDYICATVSTLNKSSKRNFILNGYILENDDKYTLDGDSQFYIYITSDDATQEEKESYSLKVNDECGFFKDTFDRLNISKENYKKDKDVPRNFVVLNLMENNYNK